MHSQQIPKSTAFAQALTTQEREDALRAYGYRGMSRDNRVPTNGVSMHQRALIVLTGRGDLEIRLVHPAAQQWIERKPTFPPDSHIAVEELPEEVRGNSGKYSTRIYRGSFDNDRAMECYGNSFGSFADMIKHVRECNVEIVYEYVGSMY